MCLMGIFEAVAGMCVHGYLRKSKTCAQESLRKSHVYKGI